MGERTKLNHARDRRVMNSREDLLLTGGCDPLLSDVNGRDDDVTRYGPIRSGTQSVTFFDGPTLPQLQPELLDEMLGRPPPDYANDQYETVPIGDAVGASDGGGAGGEEMEREADHDWMLSCPVEMMQLHFHSPAYQPLESHPSVQRAGYIPDAGAPLACSYCKERFWTKASLERHLAMRHCLITSELHAKAKAKKDGGRCERCRKVYGFGLLRHLETAHEMQLRVTDITYSCGLCPFTTCSSYQRLEAHLSQMHPDVATGAPATSEPTSGESAEGVQDMQCDDGRDSESDDENRRAAAAIDQEPLQQSGYRFSHELKSDKGAVDVYVDERGNEEYVLRGGSGRPPLLLQQVLPIPPNHSPFHEQSIKKQPRAIAKHNQAASGSQKRPPRGGKSTDSSLVKPPKQGGIRKGHNEGASGSKRILLDVQGEVMGAGGDQFECEDGLMLIPKRIRQFVKINRGQVQVVERPSEHTLDIEDETKLITVNTGMHSDWLGYKPNLHHAKALGLIDNHTLIHCVNGRTEMRSDWTGTEAPIHGVNIHPALNRYSTKEVTTLLLACPLRGHRGSLQYFVKTPEEIKEWNEAEGKLNTKYQCPGIDLETGEPCTYKPMTMSNLINHHRSKHTLRYSHYCKACGEGRTTLDYMEDHVYGGHFKMKTFKCDHCKKEFYFDYEYDNHKCKGHEPVGGEKAVVQKHGPGGPSSGGRGGHGSGRGKGGGRGRGGARGKGGARVGIETAV